MFSFTHLPTLYPSDFAYPMDDQSFEQSNFIIMRQGVKGFKVLDVPLGPGLSNHSFYLKEHSENKVNKASGSTLFVGNVHYRFDLTNENIHDLMHDLFNVFGDIESVSLSDFPIDCSLPNLSMLRNSAFAHVEFKKKSSLKAALSSNSSPVYDEIKVKIASKWGLKRTSSSHKRNTNDIIAQFKYTYGNNNHYNNCNNVSC